ncbi:hypothetical protein ScPMuIL_007454 [Solemya velum]
MRFVYKSSSLLVVCLISYVASVLDDRSSSKLQSLVNSVMRCRNVSGLGIALVKGSDVVYTGGFGYRDRERKLPVTQTTLFNIGSESKAFTATLAAHAVAEGALDWDTPLRNVFGENFRLHDEFRTNLTSLRDGFAHRLGWPSYWGFSTSAPGFTRDQLLSRYRYFSVLDEFRNTFDYSNYGYVLGATAVEHATGELWEKAIHRKIFQTLNMSDSRVGATMTQTDWNNTAYSYSVINGTYVRNDEQALVQFMNEIGPAGAVFSSADDMAKWLQYHIKNLQVIYIVSTSHD